MPSSDRKVNPDLILERKKCNFDVEEFSTWWVGGKSKLDDKRFRENFFLNDPELQDEIPSYYLSHKENYENAMKKAVRVFKKSEELKEKGMDGIENYMALFGGLLGSGLIPNGNPITVHYVMFLPTLMGQGTADQQAEWIGRAWSCGIIGTYAQTEMGHGTFIRGLETTATYDADSEEFVLNSPTLSAYKWWPGGLGHSANYAVVMAQMYSKGACHGIQPFIVQLRDEETHMPMAGIKIGEIGHKLGMNTVNNGYLGFEKVRIPRMHMLMKNAQVLKDGTFVKSPASVLTYGTMMFVRVMIVQDMVNYMSKAVTIVTRYSAIRRQSQIDPNKPEAQIIDHVTQQYKIFPPLAKTIVFKLTANSLWDSYNQVTGELEKGNLERLPELHALSCCLKSVTTTEAASCVETLRLACGGHGYMTCSNLPTTYGMVTAAVTYEGENTIMFLQTARYLMKAWSSALSNGELMPTVSYLGVAVKNKLPAKWNSSNEGIIKSLQAVAAGKVKLAFENVERRKKSGQSHEDATNATSIELAASADAHCRAFIVQSAFEMVVKQEVSPAIASVLNQLMELYAIEACLKALGDLLRFTTITERDINQLQTRLEDVLTKIRPNAVSIVDAFDIPDGILNSTLGAYDGNVYERIFEEAAKSPLNQEPVNKSFHLYLKPMMKSNL